MCMERSLHQPGHFKALPPSFINESSAADSFLIFSAAAAFASDSAYPKSTNLEVWPRLIQQWHAHRRLLCAKCCSSFICMQTQLGSPKPQVAEALLCSMSMDNFARERWVRAATPKPQSNTSTHTGEYFFTLLCHFSFDLWFCSGPLNISESNIQADLFIL